MKRLFTSESVTSGHPDKMCDLIADSILDEALKQDSESHMAVEATIKDNLVLIYGEASTDANYVFDNPVPVTSKITVDFKFDSPTSESHVNIAFLRKKDNGQADWDNFFGYFSINENNPANPYDGVTYTKCDDGYLRVVFDLQSLTKNSVLSVTYVLWFLQLFSRTTV